PQTLPEGARDASGGSRGKSRRGPLSLLRQRRLAAWSADAGQGIGRGDRGAGTEGDVGADRSAGTGRAGRRLARSRREADGHPQDPSSSPRASLVREGASGSSGADARENRVADGVPDESSLRGDGHSAK